MDEVKLGGYKQKVNSLDTTGISLSHTRVQNALKMAAEPGFEPGLEDSKSPVLPLHNSAIELDYNIQPCLNQL